jgi:N utilization substance protein B
MNKLVSRRQVREKVLQILYAHEMTKDPIEPIIAEHFVQVESKEIDHFARMLIKHTLKNNKEYEALIIETVQHWDMERIAVIDAIIIKMCLSEFLYFPEIPTKVSINESIDLAKNYSTKNSGKFVNGVVNAIFVKLKEKNKIKKKGKGLITKSIAHNISHKKNKEEQG